MLSLQPIYEPLVAVYAKIVQEVSQFICGDYHTLSLKPRIMMRCPEREVTHVYFGQPWLFDK